eukprot:121025-Pelagomonas_calceolata.AAC.2
MLDLCCMGRLQLQIIPQSLGEKVETFKACVNLSRQAQQVQQRQHREGVSVIFTLRCGRAQLGLQDGPSQMGVRGWSFKHIGHLPARMRAYAAGLARWACYCFCLASPR